VLAVQFSPDDRFVASASDDATIIVWDLAQRSVVRRFLSHRARVMALDFTPAGTSIISGGWDNQVIAWRMDSFESLLSWIIDHRYVRELTCAERLIYTVSPYCDSTDVFPTSTPITNASESGAQKMCPLRKLTSY
jgi:WD40 repeat protein